MRKANEGREDISQFVVHLTRNDKRDFTNGDTALNNLKSILKSKTIFATRSHCIFKSEIENLDRKTKELLKVACFTETPLNQIGNIAKKIEGRQIELEPYGVVFKKELLIEAGAQQAIYINSYNGNSNLRESAREIFNICKENPNSKLLNMVPFLNAMHESYDFTWEREWRVSKNFKFKLSDVVAIILPEEGKKDMKEKCATAGIAAISPGWSYEEIVSELATQQRVSRKLALSGSTKKSKTVK